MQFLLPYETVRVLQQMSGSLSWLFPAIQRRLHDAGYAKKSLIAK